MKKWFGLLLVGTYLSMVLYPSSYAFAEGLELESASVVLMEAASGEILYEKEMANDGTDAQHSVFQRA